ncbi:MAG TPA: thioredoxin family protein, partial [Acidimicrobiia bacterium]|nr:thioredoxin family protein [Acidimicrobiia bacterium]
SGRGRVRRPGGYGAGVASRLLVAVAVVVVAVVVARLLDRRRPAPPTRDAYPVPAQLDRLDFPRPDAPWLFVLFSSQTCDSCAPMAARVAALDSDTVATVEVEASADKELHRRYRIEGVPMVVLADADGVVRAGFVGSVDAWELEEALATARGGEPA